MASLGLVGWLVGRTCQLTQSVQDEDAAVAVAAFDALGGRRGVE